MRNRTVVVGDDFDLPDGSAVEVRPAAFARGTPTAVLAALQSPPHVSGADIDELLSNIDEGRREVRFDSPL